ncbi:unnamed protein product, partial [Symbiodinium sp. KB8]
MLDKVKLSSDKYRYDSQRVGVHSPLKLPSRFEAMRRMSMLAAQRVAWCPPCRRAKASMVAEHLARILPPVAARCKEARQEERSPLISDPLACPFLDAFGPAPEEPEEIQRARVVHDAFLDRLLLDAVSRRVRQTLLLGSGLDVRAFRLQLPPQLKVIEVDETNVHEAKSLVLESLGARPRAALRRLASADADPTKPCFFIILIPPAEAITAIPLLA